MELKPIAVGAVAMLLIVSAVGAGAFVATGGLNSSNQADTSRHDHSAHNHGQQTTTSEQQTVSEDEVPDDVKKSIAGAKALKANLSESEKFANATVSIKKTGDVVVHYGSQANTGPELKEEMGAIAVRYAHVVNKYNETGGLEVRANGVKLLVSSDAAEAYAEGRLKDNAFKQTFYWGSYQHHTESKGSN